MDKFRIKGGRPLEGAVQISGAKNSALPCMAAALLTPETVTLHNLPYVRDIITMRRLLEDLGCTALMPELRTLKISAHKVEQREAPYDLVKTMRASVLALGPLLARFGEARVSLPGGCAIGARPIDQHLKGLEAMGARIHLVHGYVEAECERLKGAEICFDLPTVTGTENLMMAAALAKGRTTLVNAAREPEVEELGRVLNKMGAHVEGAGGDIIVIEGRSELSPFDHAIIADRIEAGTFMVAAAATRGDVLIRHAPFDALEPVVVKLRLAGVQIEREGDGVRVAAPRRTRSVNVTTAPHPGFPTDMQAQMMVLMCIAEGESVITETVFENRFMHVPELLRMGAEISVRGHTAIVNGVESLYGASVMATDLRASASLVIAGLIATDGETEIRRVYHLDRGYERIERKLAPLGADVVRVAGTG